MAESDIGDSEPVHRHGSGLRVRVLYEKTIEPLVAAGADRLCGRRDGRGVVEELIPEMSAGEHSNIGVVMFALGFTVMMALDVALG